MFRRSVDATVLDIPDDVCRRCFIWNAACVAQLQSDPEGDLYARFFYFFDVPLSLLADLSMQVLEATYHTRVMPEIKCIRKAFRLGIIVIDDVKTRQMLCP